MNKVYKNGQERVVSVAVMVAAVVLAVVVVAVIMMIQYPQYSGLEKKKS